MDTFSEAELPHLHTSVDFVVCLGGDGLLLHAASLFGSAMPPLISFKLGSLGFLTTHKCGPAAAVLSRGRALLLAIGLWLSGAAADCSAVLTAARSPTAPPSLTTTNT